MRRPVRAWLILMAMTAATAIAYGLGGQKAAPLAWLGALGVITILKGRLILFDYLELRPTPWRGAAVAGMIIISALITLLLAAGNN